MVVQWLRLCAPNAEALGLIPDQGSNLGPLDWELGVLATGPPGESLVCF